MELGDTYRGKTVLITGDTGFKGSWLAIWLTELGAKVIGFALPPAGPRDNFVICEVARSITHVDGDVRDYDALTTVLGEHQPDIVFHLAAQALVLDSYKDPRGTFATNVMGVVNLLEAVRYARSVRAVVVVTSDKCYENQGLDRGYRESDPLGGRDPYSASKGAAEIAASSMRRSFFTEPGDAAIATARAGNVIGGGDWAANRIVPDCIRALASLEPIVVRNPSAIRPWQHVMDALNGYLVLGTKLLADGHRYAEAWNFGPAPGEVVPVSGLVEQMIAAWGSGTYRVEADAGAPAEARILHLDIAKAREQLAWSPKLSLAQAIAATVQGYRAERDDAAAIYAHRAMQISAFRELP
ncbi:MAG: CDP-glucose 4,6-dehydratase [Deltaproteobacteria bacterium]|nr:CDP-glucose 4,6-dehydratase [Deltaproteobacteria bacterium]